MCYSLLQLPSELIAHIIEFIQDVETLRNLATTCSRLQAAAEVALYQTIFHRSGEQVIRLCKAVESRPERADGIQVVDSRCKWQKRAGLEFLAPVISQAKHLRELTIESPYCSNAYGEEAEQWRQTMSSLLRPICDINTFGVGSQLKCLTLHLTAAGRYWVVDNELCAIFRHPTLRSLTISCAELHEDSLKCLKGASRTPLEQLVLIECNISLEALHCILAVPRSLRELQLGENCYHKWLKSPQFRVQSPRAVYQLSSTDGQAFFSSLSQQSHSLETLTYSTNGPNLSTFNFPKRSRGLSDFTLLKHVMLDGDCAFFEAALKHERTAPPNLVSLEAKGNMLRLQCNPGLSLADDYQSQVSWTLAAASASPHLRNVRIVSNRTFTNVSKNHRDAVMDLGQAFKDKKVRMQLLKRTFHRFIPPFLFGEHEPTEELIYGTEEGFCQELRPSADRAMNDIDF